ncbi:hypothetical protein WN944_009446 [Citrus x changshan-huyou]|uniref:Disease resistance protein At4g27190-like leucine-rich repeats domain-containing protein n=1 Tax=Citrus x changshan-huyou TaxID=2935761 RepID=A0AAP0QW81_9ROSI
MKVESCKRLLTIFPPEICGRFLKLESLMVTNCGSLEEIFDLEGMDFEEQGSGAAKRPKIEDSGESETSTSEETDHEEDGEGSKECFFWLFKLFVVFVEFPATSEDEEESETSMSEEIDEEEDEGNCEEVLYETL